MAQIADWSTAQQPPAEWSPPRALNSEVRGNAATRRDANMFEIDTQGLRDAVDALVQKLPSNLRGPVGLTLQHHLAGFVALANLFSSPESVALMGMPAATKVMDVAASKIGPAAQAAKMATGKVAGAALEAVDPELVSILSPRGGAMVKKAQQIFERARARRAATAPLETASASPAPAAELPTGRTLEAPPPSNTLPDQAANTWPDQRALNEEALARRAAEYRARVAAPVKPKLSAAEAKVALELRAKHLPDADIWRLIEATRGLARGGGTLTDAEVAAEYTARIGNRSPTR